MATGLDNEKTQILTGFRIKTPQTIAKNVTDGYDVDPYSCAKFGANPSKGASVQMGIIYFLFIYICPLFRNYLTIQPDDLELATE